MRIELHPATDRWMMGDRYGTVTSRYTRKGTLFYRVTMDRSKHKIWVPEDLIGRWL